jgi:hypothetical protein
LRWRLVDAGAVSFMMKSMGVFSSTDRAVRVRLPE